MEENSTPRRRRSFSSREKLLLAVFVVLALTVGWLRLVWQPIQTRQEAAETRRENAELQTMQEKLRAEKKKAMLAALDAIEADPAAAPLPMSGYNNYLNVLSELRRQLGSRSYESIGGLEAEPCDEAGVYRRSVTVYNVVCADYAEARALCDSVAAGPYRCMLKSVSFVAEEDEAKPGEAAPLTVGDALPAEPALSYHTLLTFTVTYYEQELPREIPAD